MPHRQRSGATTRLNKAKDIRDARSRSIIMGTSSARTDAEKRKLWKKIDRLEKVRAISDRVRSRAKHRPKNPSGGK